MSRPLHATLDCQVSLHSSKRRLHEPIEAVTVAMFLLSL